MITSDFLCLKCKHLRKFEGGCKAFPDGIPMEISEEGLEHTKPLPDQGNDIVFEPKDNTNES